MGSRRRRTAAAAAFAVVVAAAIAAIALNSGAPTRRDADATGVPPGDTTATVTRRTLTESSTVDGTLGYGTTLELYDRLAGTFTWLPSVGATIGRGGTLWRIDNLPVVLMYGTVPAYRALKEGVGDGPDVAELNRNLIDLGYDPYGAIADLEAFGEATAAAVRRWQHAAGLPETGEVELGRVVFAPSARRVTTVHVTLGQDPPGASEDPKAKKPKAGHGKKPHEKSSAKLGESPTKEATKEPGTKAPATKESQSKEPASKEADKGSPPKEASKEPSRPEGGSGAGEVVLTTSSTQQLVQVNLKAEQQQLARVGERAPVTLPGGKVVQGQIIEVGTVASEAKGNGGEGEKGAGASGSPGNEGSGESATIPVTLALTRRAPRLDQAPVSVELVKTVRREVLAVPATALVATGGGNYAIEVLEAGRRTELAVTPGMFANGYVQIEGTGLHEGQTVIESE